MNEPDRDSGELTAIEQAAADWFTRRDAGLSPPDRAEFERWLSADLRHRQAYVEMEAAWSVVTRPSRRGRSEDVVAELVVRAARRWRARWGVALAGVAAAVAIFVFPRRPMDVPVAGGSAPALVVPRPERQVLADGSAIEIKAGAEVEVYFSSAERSVRLLRGAAHFAVAKDPTRPFVVSAGTMKVRAIGTEFVVDFAPEKIDVLVTEGRVRVEAAAPADASFDAASTPVLVTAGARATVAIAESAAAAPAVVELSGEEIARAIAWRNHRVEFCGMILAEAVALFNRQNRLQLQLADESLAALRVSGIYWTDNPTGFANLIAAIFGLQIQQEGGTIVIRR